jgi:hypothetical protein
MILAFPRKLSSLNEDNIAEIRELFEEELQHSVSNYDWAFMSRQISTMTLDENRTYETDVRKYVEAFIGYYKKTKNEQQFRKYLMAFNVKWDISGRILPSMSFHYSLMSLNKKKKMIEFVARYTGLTFTLIELEQIFDTAFCDKCFLDFDRKLNPDIEEKIVFYIWDRLIGETPPETANDFDKINKMKNINYTNNALFLSRLYPFYYEKLL